MIEQTACTIVLYATFVRWSGFLALALKSKDNGERIIDKRNGIRVLFKCVSYLYMVWGFFGVYEVEKADCMPYILSADFDCLIPGFGNGCFLGRSICKARLSAEQVISR
jgi:hypothetical protein